MTARKILLTPPLKAMEARYVRLEKARSRLCDQLQIMEMGNGYAHMMKSEAYREYCGIKTRCEKLCTAIAAARRQV